MSGEEGGRAGATPPPLPARDPPAWPGHPSTARATETMAKASTVVSAFAFDVCSFFCRYFRCSPIPAEDIDAPSRAPPCDPRLSPPVPHAAAAAGALPAAGAERGSPPSPPSLPRPPLRPRHPASPAAEGAGGGQVGGAHVLVLLVGGFQLVAARLLCTVKTFCCDIGTIHIFLPVIYIWL